MGTLTLTLENISSKSVHQQAVFGFSFYSEKYMLSKLPLFVRGWTERFTAETNRVNNCARAQLQCGVLRFSLSPPFQCVRISIGNWVVRLFETKMNYGATSLSVWGRFFGLLYFPVIRWTCLYTRWQRVFPDSEARSSSCTWSRLLDGALFHCSMMSHRGAFVFNHILTITTLPSSAQLSTTEPSALYCAWTSCAWPWWWLKSCVSAAFCSPGTSRAVLPVERHTFILCFLFPLHCWKNVRLVANVKKQSTASAKVGP